MTKLCIFRRAGRTSGAAFGRGQPELGVAQMGNNRDLAGVGEGHLPTELTGLGSCVPLSVVSFASAWMNYSCFRFSWKILLSSS